MVESGPDLLQQGVGYRPIVASREARIHHGPSLRALEMPPGVTANRDMVRAAPDPRGRGRPLGTMETALESVGECVGRRIGTE